MAWSYSPKTLKNCNFFEKLLVKDGEDPVDYDSVNNFAANYKDILEAIYELWSQTNKKRNRFGMFEFHIINDDLKIVEISSVRNFTLGP